MTIIPVSQDIIFRIDLFFGLLSIWFLFFCLIGLAKALSRPE